MTGGRMPGRWRRFVCRIRGHHADSSHAVSVAVAVLACADCGRVEVVPHHDLAQLTLVQHAERCDVALVDRAALELLTFSAETGAIAVGMLMDGEGPP